jgi:hypothetical protein
LGTPNCLTTLRAGEKKSSFFCGNCRGLKAAADDLFSSQIAMKSVEIVEKVSATFEKARNAGNFYQFPNELHS